MTDRPIPDHDARGDRAPADPNPPGGPEPSGSEPSRPGPSSPEPSTPEPSSPEPSTPAAGSPASGHPTPSTLGTDGPAVAVLWDLDGVLVDTEGLLLEAEQIAFAAYGVELTARTKSRFVGLGGTEVMRATAEHLGVQEHVDDLVARKIAAFTERQPELRGFSPTTRMVRLLAEAGVPQAVASGSPADAIATALRVVGLDDVLTVQVSVEQVAAGKPAPDVFLAAADRLGATPDRCVVVEDAVPGVIAAGVAGMRCLAIPSVTDPLDPRFEQADLLVREGMAGADADRLVDWVLHP